MIREAVILAGGLGTRLRSAVPDLPKCMAPVAGKPFLTYVINHLLRQGISRFVFSLGYRSDIIEAWLQEEFPSLDYRLSVEAEPMGTGGAIKMAAAVCQEENIIILNGDTLFTVNVQQLSDFHSIKKADCSLTLKPMQSFDRYGVVELDEQHNIKTFKEKQFYKEGLINGGVYALNRIKFMQEELPEKFSFEKDYLEKYFSSRKMCGLIQDDYFIDIGIPEDFERANAEFADMEI